MYKAQVKPRYWSSGWGDCRNVSLRLLFSVVNAGVDCCAPSSALLVRFGGLVKEQKDSVNLDYTHHRGMTGFRVGTGLLFLLVT